MSNYNQHQVISWLEDLIPEINKTKDPENVILKFASEQNLKPAVMEKLAQVFNTAKTLNYLDRTTDARGATFSLVDPEAIVAKYTSTDNITKAASVKREDHTYSSNPYEFPDVFGALENTCLSDNNTLENEGYEQFFNVKKAFYDKSVSKANLETLEQIAFDIGEDIREDMFKLANIFRKQNDFDFEDFEKRAKARFPESTEHLDKVAEFLTKTKLRVKRASEEFSGSLIKDNLGEIELFKRIIENTELLKSANELIKESTTATLERPQTETQPDTDTSIESEPIRSPSRKRRRGGRGQEEEEHSGRGINPDDESPWRDKQKQRQIVINNTATGGSGGSGGGSGGGGGSDGGGSDGDSIGISNVVRDIFDPVTGGLISGETNIYGEKIKELFGGGINQKQLDVDDAAAQVRSEIALNTLLMTDPVIADADEEVVREYFDTLASVAPEVTRDINVLRSILRQQVQFDGIDYPTIKDLSSTEKQLAETRDMRRKEIQSVYGSSRSPIKPK